MTKNTTFMEEFAVNIRDYTADLEQRIGLLQTKNQFEIYRYSFKRDYSDLIF